MAEVKWIKLYTDIFDNRKIKQIEVLPDGDSILVIWLKLLTLAGNINDSGMVYFTKDIAYTDQMLASQFNKPIALIQMALNVFEKFEMIEVVNDVMHITNWEKYQDVKRMDDLKQYNRIKQQEHRERVKQLSTMSIDSQGIDIDIDKDIDIDIDKDIDKEKDKDVCIQNVYKDTPKRFTPPTLEEVKAYCKERNNNVDAQRFVDFYASKGWMVGKNKMKDWKAAVRTWEKDKKYTAESMNVEDANIDEIRRKMFND